VAMAWALGPAQDAIAGTRRGGGECREDVAAARVLGATQALMRGRGCWSKERREMIEGSGGRGRLGAGGL
jgi:hypothetical protein